MNSGRRIKKSGFTIVELVVVIGVIGVLAAAITMGYSMIQQDARRVTLMADLDNAASSLEFDLKADGSYPATVLLADNGRGLQTGSGTTYQYTVNTSTTNPSYCLTGTNGTDSYMISSNTSTPIVGGCPGHGTGGVAAITNMATDPRAISYMNVTGQAGWRTGRWAGTSPASATYTLVTGASDGPLDIATYARKTWTVAPAAMGNTGDTGFSNVTNNIAVTQGTTYAISCYLRPSVNRNFYIGVYQYTPAGAAFTTVRVAGPTTAGPAGQWTRVSYLYTVPTGVGLIGIVCDSNSSTANGAVNWAVGSTLDGTGLMITAGNTLYNYADRLSPNWIWNGDGTSTGPPL